MPVRDEAAALPACLQALDRAAASYPGEVAAVLLCNDCRDHSAALARAFEPASLRVEVAEMSLPPGRRHAGWARRLALDAAAALLRDERDLLLSTDADTAVAPDWISANARHLLAGAAAVAGRALTLRAERAALPPAARARLNLLGRYFVAIDWLRAHADPAPHDPWPRHGYEGGASMATTLGWYRRIGGAPAPPLAEDRAFFGAIRRAGGRVRHPLDVRVWTSCRLGGRAPGGMADTLARWVEQPEDAPIHECYDHRAMLAEGPHDADRLLSFARLPAELEQAQALIRQRRRTLRLRSA